MSPPVEENKALVRRFFAAIERGDFDIFDQIVAQDYNDHLAGQSPGRDNHYGQIKASGNRVDAMAFQLYRIANGQLAEHWEVADFATIMRQLQA